MVHTPSSQHFGGRGSWIYEFRASLIYRVSSRLARATQRNSVSKNKQIMKELLYAVPKNLISSVILAMAVSTSSLEGMSITGAVAGLGLSPASCSCSLLAKLVTLCCGLQFVMDVAEGPVYF